MLVHRIARVVRGIAPTKVFGFIRSVGTGVLTPLFFSYQSGHIRSSLKGKSVDKLGNPLPWYTYPAIDLLTTKDFTGKRVLEFGAGHSTLWWAVKAERVVSLEDNFEWYGWLKKRVPSNVELLFNSDAGSDIEANLRGKRFDVIVIDGLDRLACAQKAINLLADGGAIVLDNSDGFWGANGSYPIMDLFREHSFCRVDLYGHAPGVILPACTSILFKGSCFLLAGQENPVRFVK